MTPSTTATSAIRKAVLVQGRNNAAICVPGTVFHGKHAAEHRAMGLDAARKGGLPAARELPASERARASGQAQPTRLGQSVCTDPSADLSIRSYVCAPKKSR